MLCALVSEGRILSIAARALGRSFAVYFSVRWREAEVGTRHQEDQKKYALFKSRHRQVILQASELI
jgi:hypothetical protein